MPRLPEAPQRAEAKGTSSLASPLRRHIIVRGDSRLAQRLLADAEELRRTQEECRTTAQLLTKSAEPLREESWTQGKSQT